MKKKYYKFTEANRKTYDGFEWPPVGEWTEPIEGELIPCENGYHVTDKDHLAIWIDAELYEVEIDGDIVASEDNEKYVVRRARLTKRLNGWNEKTQRLFAVWCAREVLKLVANPDPRSVNACDVAERYANGQATDKELAAARASAHYSASAAARAAAWDAARATAVKQQSLKLLEMVKGG